MYGRLRSSPHAAAVPRSISGASRARIMPCTPSTIYQFHGRTHSVLLISSPPYPKHPHDTRSQHAAAVCQRNESCRDWPIQMIYDTDGAAPLVAHIMCRSKERIRQRLAAFFLCLAHENQHIPTRLILRDISAPGLISIFLYVLLLYTHMHSSTYIRILF